ncbi:Hypothetical predicted protein [Paramuricea clavata]|uniref:Uncharacterized protein n=1 Tax=Paramuricea clavata TaxID=317549 RepID=A0A6S7HVR7_PARCT|nr:Hypothetical predicted protein [Paramuricea clavata]
MPPLVSGSKRPRIDNSTDVLTANNSGLQFECDRNNTPGNKDLKNCHSCGKSFKNLKLHLTKKPACKNVYDFSSIEAESDLRIKTRQTVYKEKNRSQINVKKKEYRELKHDKITEYNSANKKKIRKNQEIYNRKNKDKVRSRQEKYNRENKDEVRARQEKYNRENRDGVRARQEKNNCENKDEVRARQEKYNCENKDEVRARQEKYNSENKDELREKQRKYDTENKEKVREKQKKHTTVNIKKRAAVRNGPIFPCLSCYRLLYSNGVRSVSDKFKENVNANDNFYDRMVTEIRATDGQIYLCHTCHRSLYKTKCPSMSTKNGLSIDEIPSVLNLSEMESVLIAKNILFFKLFKLPKTRWAGIRDKLVNVPINDNDLLKTLSNLTKLPRGPDNAGLLPVKIEKEG